MQDFTASKTILDLVIFNIKHACKSSGASLPVVFVVPSPQASRIITSGFDAECSHKTRSILLVGYVACQIPSNMILNTITRPSWYLCRCVATWGMISACTAATHNAVGAIMCRFFLGCAESAFFPGSIYYLSRWYTRQEMQLPVDMLRS